MKCLILFMINFLLRINTLKNLIEEKEKKDIMIKCIFIIKNY